MLINSKRTNNKTIERNIVCGMGLNNYQINFFEMFSDDCYQN